MLTGSVRGGREAWGVWTAGGALDKQAGQLHRKVCLLYARTLFGAEFPGKPAVPRRLGPSTCRRALHL